MDSTRRLDNPAHLPRLERECRLLKLLLHLSSAEEAPTRTKSAPCRLSDGWMNIQITPLPRTAIIALRNRQIPQLHLPALYPRLVPLQNLQRLLLAPCNLGLPSATRPPAIAVLDQQVRGPDLTAFAGGAAGGGGGAVGVGGRGGVVGRHVGFELLGVGAGGRLPAGFLSPRVEVVGEVFGLRVADFPTGRETGGFGGGRLLGSGEWVEEWRGSYHGD